MFTGLSCNVGWVTTTHRPGYCFKHFTSGLSFDAANAMCQSFPGGSLVSIRSALEHDWLFDDM